MNIDPRLAADLSKVSDPEEAARRALREESQRATEARQLEFARQFEKAAQRAAKGILPRPQRHKMMRRALARYEAEHE